MKKTILIATEKPFAENARDEAIRIIKESGLAVKLLEGYKDSNDLIKSLKGVHGLIVRSDKIDKKIIDSADSLKLIVRGGAGYDSIDHAYAEQKGIIVETTPGQNANAVAELAIQMMLSAQRPINGKTGSELKGKVLGIHGFGNIGSIVCKFAISFGMSVKAYDPFLSDERAKDCGVIKTKSASELYSGSDIISLHIPSVKETIESINYNLLKLMNEKSILINTARAEVIHEESLLKILKDKPNFKYFSDVSPSSKTFDKMIKGFSDRVLISPKKQGAQTAEANFNTAVACAKQSSEFFSSGVVLYAVNNPLPEEMEIFTTLAQYLGRFNKSFIGNPTKINVFCYGDLNKYKTQLGQYILKGLFFYELGPDITPDEASDAAKKRGIVLNLKSPDNTRGHGHSITIDFISPTGRHSIRGRVDEGDLQINRVGEFKMNIPLKPGAYIIAQYKEKAGMADKIGHAISSKGYNKIDGGFRQDKAGKNAMIFFRISDDGLKVCPIINHEIKKMDNVSSAICIDLH